jgi:hypothetical protein
VRLCIGVGHDDEPRTDQVEVVSPS